MHSQTWRTPMIVLGCGALVLCLSLGIRHAFGLFLQPMSTDLGWGRGVFAFAIAVQNLVWGISQPFVGRLADRYGAGWTVVGGAIFYILGMYLMSQSANEMDLLLSAGILIGVGLSGTTFPVVFGVVSRTITPERRSWAMGVATAVGSFGQFVFLPGSNALILELGWSDALLLLTGLSLLMLPLAAALMEPARKEISKAVPLHLVLKQVSRCRDFWLLAFGFFVCGFQVVFIATHLPGFLTDGGVAPTVGAVVLGLIGLFNVFGSYTAGIWGDRKPKPQLLSFIYMARFGVIAVFLLLPLSPAVACLFGMAMGLLWLSTVPLTNGTVATLFGVENLSMLGGIVFLFHQIGSFFGGWLGGYLYDLSGNYNVVWLFALTLSLIAALLNWPIRERVVALETGA